MSGAKAAGTRSVALVGPSLAGKTTLLENLLFIMGALKRKGHVKDGNTVGDTSPEARARRAGVEVNIASAEWMGDRYSFLDCPGSIEFQQETHNALMGVDLAVVVCEPDPARAGMLRPLMQFLDEHGIPHMLFVNKIDRASGAVRDLLPALQTASRTPLVLRQIPIREGDKVTGYVDLASERAYLYRPGHASERIELPAAVKEREVEARYQMLEKLADFDDRLMADLLDDKEPPKEAVFDDLTADLRQGKIVPVFLGAAEHEEGVRRLLKALRHEAPPPEMAARRFEGALAKVQGPVAQVLKTSFGQQGKMSIARVWKGEIPDGTILNGERAGGLFRPMGGQYEKISNAKAGDIVAIGRLEKARTGDTLVAGAGKEGLELPRAPVLPPVYAIALQVADRKDEVKLATALHKLVEEDPSLVVEQQADTHELVMAGQGEVHLRVALDRLGSKYGLKVASRPPKVPYKEAIKKGAKQHGRYKRQTGGHGQFGDIHIEIQPLPRGSGFRFKDTITGGVVPKQYIPAVEDGVREYLVKGPLGFPVVDVEVTLTDGSYHDVDSSEQAFKMAARIAMTEGMPQCGPVLLEPVCRVEILTPNDATAKLNGVVTGRRGRVLGFDGREGWDGWDVLSAEIPRAELRDLIVELRSLTQGVGTYTWRDDHLQELTGRLADQVLAAQGN
ncbi:MAG: elongation factor G, partial [Alphaproteobacteria bacterium]|nr:elongation factor G [Alphaproteobacteria bacterium]